MLAPLVPMATERHSTGRTFGPSDSASWGVISLAEGLFSDRSENIFWLADPLGGVPLDRGTSCQIASNQKSQILKIIL